MRNVALCLLLIFGLAACGGGGGAAYNAPTEDPFAVETDTMVLGGTTLRVLVDDQWRDIDGITWRDDLAQGTDGTAQYILRRDPNHVLAAGRFGDDPFATVAGTLANVEEDKVIRYGGQITVVSRDAVLTAPIDLTLSTEWTTPRLLGSITAHQLDVAATVQTSGQISGRVGYNGAYADLSGGLWGADFDSASVGAAFSGDAFYGLLTGDPTGQ